MNNKEEKLTFEEQRINELLTESIDLSLYPGISPHSFPLEFTNDCITLEQFDEEGINYLKQLFEEYYGVNNDFIK